jgi:hypothetical protein
MSTRLLLTNASNVATAAAAAAAAAAVQVPKVWAIMAVSGLIAAVIMPVMAVIQTANPVGLWLLLPLMVGACGLIGGIMTTIGPQIYPPAVRATGYNLGHNL